MRDLSRAWTEAMLQRGVATLPWGSIIELLGIQGHRSQADHDAESWCLEFDFNAERGRFTKPVSSPSRSSRAAARAVRCPSAGVCSLSGHAA